MPKRNKLMDLPEDVKSELIARVAANRFSRYEEHEAWLEHKGYHIGKSSIHRAMQPYEQIFTMVQFARMIQSACGEKIDLGAALQAVAAINLAMSVEILIKRADVKP